MTNRAYQYFCLHSHFYQPPRGNPFTGEITPEPDAGKYPDWNHRITAESYRPNAEIGNFDRISFDIGQSLMRWMEHNATDTHQRIIQADKNHVARWKVGNAVGGAYNEVLLPLHKSRDKQAELVWGRAAFVHHFGRLPQGLWLPEMAVDLETLQIAEALGYRYTIVAQGQVDGVVDQAGPYWVDLENGKKIAVFVRNDELSNDLSFRISEVGGAGHWARNKLGGRRARNNALTLLATDGETFGHHHLGEERFLHWLIEHEAPAVGYKTITLDEYLGLFPPRETIALKPCSSWSNGFSIRQWVTGNGAWKSLLRRALDHLSDEIGFIYRDLVRPHGIDPYALREGYISVWLGEQTGEQYLASKAANLPDGHYQHVLAALRAQMLMAKSHTSNAFFVESLDAPQTRYAIGLATNAIHTLRTEIGVDLQTSFRNNLYLVADGDNGLNGSHLYDQVVAEYLTPKSDEMTLEA
jgi:hypothetical protein